MYHVEYLFDLDIADKALKKMFEPAGMPYPIITNAVQNTLTYTAPRMLTQEEQTKLIEVSRKEFRNMDLGKFIVVDAHYAGIRNAYFVPDESDISHADNQKSGVNKVKAKLRKSQRKC